MEVIEYVAAPAQTFIHSCNKVLKRCTLPTMKTLKKTALVSGVGFAVLGTVGFAFKLISIPINNVIIGGMVH